MSNPFFEQPVLNSPYEYPDHHWELDETGQPTQQIIDRRRPAQFITPIPNPKKIKGSSADQSRLAFGDAKDISTQNQQYELTAIINSVRQQVDRWRRLPNPNQWQVTPETARLLQHWRHHRYSGIRPFFCQVEAVETVIWLTEVAPQAGRTGKRFLDHLADANHEANSELQRLALKLATGAAKTTVMAMLIAWQTVNAVRHPQSRRFTRGFLMVTPGITIKGLQRREFLRPPRLLSRCQRPLQSPEDDPQGGNQRGSLGNASRRHLPAFRQARLRPHRRESNQSPRRRGDEGVSGVKPPLGSGRAPYGQR